MVTAVEEGNMDGLSVLLTYLDGVPSPTGRNGANLGDGYQQPFGTDGLISVESSVFDQEDFDLGNLKDSERDAENLLESWNMPNPEAAHSMYKQVLSMGLKPAAADNHELTTLNPVTIVIGAIVLEPNGGVCVYTKQHLAPSEASVFDVGMGGALAQVGDEQVTVPICYDTAHASHPAAAADAGASIYAAGIWSTPEEADMIKARFEGHALRHRLTVVVANYGGPTAGGAASGGGSAIWSSLGTLVVKAPESGVCLVVATTDVGNQTWSGSVIHDILLS